MTRPLNLRRANLFTLNYDTLIEQGADAEGAVLVDGFVGNMKRVFRPESYDLDFYFPAQTTEGRVHRFDRALHLYKLHGSITWHRTDQGWENPYGLYATFFNQQCKDDDVLIYPSPLKYGQALGLPYSELFRRFGNAVVQPQSVLFTIGYGFGDEHVNAIIRQALAIPSFTLIVVDPNPSSDFVKELQKIGDERVWIVSGWDIGTFGNFVKQLLPDLREEEIDAKVMKTFKALAFKETQPEVDDGE
ncbi:MAG: SIR2 family protein [Geobacter sp.]